MLITTVFDVSFFFSSRRRHTILVSDWSSDVCSSDLQHVFHSGYERAVGLRRDDPVLAAMGLKSVFLSARPIVLSLARSTMPSSTTLFSNNRKVQRARPLGGLEQAKAISLASLSPSKIRATAGIARGLRLNTASKPSSTSCLRTR